MKKKTDDFLQIKNENKDLTFFKTVYIKLNNMKLF
jgi:hypothetical protein